MKVGIRALVAIGIATLIGLSAAPAAAQDLGEQAQNITWETGVPTLSPKPYVQSVAEAQSRNAPPSVKMQKRWERMQSGVFRRVESDKWPDRTVLQNDPNSPAIAQYPAPAQKNIEFLRVILPRTPQTVGLSFQGGSITDGPLVPPDSMGAVGPTQVLVGLNNRLRTFNKTTGLADGFLNLNIDTFFQTVAPTGVSDPRVYFDPTSQRWFIAAITLTSPNRLVCAISSGPNITSSSNFTIYWFQQDLVGTQPNQDTGGFADYVTMGVDSNAVYLGAVMFNGAGTSYLGASVWVLRKAEMLSGVPTLVTPFRRIGSGSAGIFCPQPASNDEPAAPTGFVVGVDVAVFGRLVMHKITGSGGTPSISSAINLTVPSTSFPRTNPHLGGTAPLDALDDRLFDVSVHFDKINNRRTLWTSHNINVGATGVASGTANRNAMRWYEYENLGAATPTLRQSGTIFDPAASNPVGYWIGTTAMSMQGHMVTGFSSAGAAQRTGISYAGRLAGDGLGTSRTPTTAAISSFNYNIEGFPYQRWGDYSHTVVDPSDGMSMWTFQEICNGNNSWGVQVLKLLAPPPASIASLSTAAAVQGATLNVTINGTVVNGSGFFDPGAGFTNRLAVSFGAGITVNTVTFTSPTQVSANITIAGTAATGARTVTVTNPDGQQVSLPNAFTVVAPTPSITSLNPTSVNAGSPGFNLTINGSGFIPSTTGTFNGNARTITYVNGSQLTMAVLASDVVTAGSYPVRVQNGATVSNIVNFTVNPAGPQNVFVTSSTIITGTFLGGSIANLQTSNNQYYAMLNTEFDTDGELIFLGTSPLQTVSRIDFITETSVSRPNIIGFYALFDYGVTNDWETLNVVNEQEIDTTRTLNVLTNPSRFIQAGTRTVRSQIRWVPSESYLDAPDWSFLIDQARWLVYP